MIPQYETTHEWVKRMEKQKLEEKPKKKKKQPTGILKELMELKRYSTGFENVGSVLNENGAWIKRSDVEEIINKYLNT